MYFCGCPIEQIKNETVEDAKEDAKVEEKRTGISKRFYSGCLSRYIQKD